MGNLLKRLQPSSRSSWWHLAWLLPLCLSILGFWYPLAWAWLIHAAIITVPLASIYLLIYFSDKSQKLEAIKLEQAKAKHKRLQMDLFLQRLYRIQHPKHASDVKRYDQWLTRYTGWFYRYVTYDKQAWYMLDRHLSVSKGLRQKYQDLYGPVAGQIKDLPPAVKEFFSS